MSDWAMYELEDIAWDVFGDSSDGIVPHSSAEVVNNSEAQGDFNKKARHNVGNAIERNANDNGSIAKSILQEDEETAFCSSFTDEKCQILSSSLSHASKNVFLVSRAPEYMNEVPALVSNDTGTCDYSFNAHNVDAVRDGFCSENPILGNMGTAEESNRCQFSVDISQPENGLDLLENDSKDRENTDLMDYEWPDVGDFEDVDRMFRYSAFGQVSTENADELSWFSSPSYTIDGSEDTFKSSFEASCSELSALRTSSERREARTIIWPENGIVGMDNDKSSSTEYRSYAHRSGADTRDKGDIDFTGQSNECNGVNKSNTSALTQSSNKNSMSSSEGSNMISTQRNLSKSLHQSDGKKKDKPLGYTSTGSYHFPGPVTQYEDSKCISMEVSAPKTCLSHLVGHQNHFTGPDSSSYLHSHNPGVKMKHSHSPHQFPMTKSASCIKSQKETKPSLSIKIPPQASNHGQLSVKKTHDPFSKSPTMSEAQKIEEMHLSQQVISRLTTGNPAEKPTSSSVLTNESSTMKKMHKLESQVGADDEPEQAGRENINPSYIPENSCTPWSENILLSPTTLRQLQNVMNQLDIRIKLCIRDGLYRLARSAERRHGIDSTRLGCRESMGTSKIVGIDDSKRCHGFIDVETGTNPIDRSIAHLLFHRASERSLGPAEDVMSFESRILRADSAPHPKGPCNA